MQVIKEERGTYRVYGVSRRGVLVHIDGVVFLSKYGRELIHVHHFDRKLNKNLINSTELKLYIVTMKSSQCIALQTVCSSLIYVEFWAILSTF